MEKLLIFINGLSKEERAVLFKKIDTSENYLRKAVSNKEILREKLCAQLEINSNGAVTRKDLRPDDWAEIWPELKEQSRE